MIIQNMGVVNIALAELFVYCYFGEMISANLEAIAVAAYTETTWYNCPPRLRRHLAMSIITAQQRRQLSGFGLAVMSCRMETFAGVCPFDF